MGRHGRKKREGSLFLAVILSGILFTIISTVGRDTVYGEYDWNLWKRPMVAMMLSGVHDGIYPWDVVKGSSSKEVEKEQHGIDDFVENLEDMKQYGKGDSIENLKEVQQSMEKDEFIENVGTENTPLEEQQTKVEEDETKVKEDETQGGMESQEDHGQQEVTTVVELGAVEQDYFDHVLFIGDSRTVGLFEYSYLNNATYYADEGLSVYSIFNEKFIDLGEKKVRIEEALADTQFQVIYVMLGVNELGTGNSKTFASKYKEVIERIQELQPDAYIVIQAIMNLGKELSDRDKFFNNENITSRNEELKLLADNQRIFFLDVNEVFVDEEGYLSEGYTYDNVHLKAKYYNQWADYLMSNGIVISQTCSNNDK